MKNYLQKLALITLGLLVFNCAESDKNVDESDDMSLNDDEVIIDDDENTNEEEEENSDDGSETGDGSEDNGNNDGSVDDELVLTDCLICPAYTLTQTTDSGNDEVVTVPEAKVCKGEDGKAYLDSVVNEDFETYELYLQNRQMFGTRCQEE